MVCERRSPHIDCLPPAELSSLATCAILQCGPQLLRGRIALAHFDPGTGDSLRAQLSRRTSSPLIPPLLRSMSYSPSSLPFAPAAELNPITATHGVLARPATTSTTRQFRSST